MKIVILRGGPMEHAPRRPSEVVDPSSSDRGVTAIAGDDGRWALINVSAAVAHQLEAEPQAGSDPALRRLHETSARIVLLTDAQIEHVGGLLSLRRGAPIDLYATPAVFEELTTTLPVLPVLQHYCGVHWRVIPVAGDQRAASFRVEGMSSLEFTAVATRLPPPPHAARERDPVVGDSIAIAVRDRLTGQRVFCAPGLRRLGPSEIDWMEQADCLLVDAPGHDPAPTEWMERLARLPARRKVLFAEHQDRASPESRRAWAARGIELAYDGLEITL